MIRTFTHVIPWWSNFLSRPTWPRTRLRDTTRWIQCLFVCPLTIWPLLLFLGLCEMCIGKIQHHVDSLCTPQMHMHHDLPLFIRWMLENDTELRDNGHGWWTCPCNVLSWAPCNPAQERHALKKKKTLCWRLVTFTIRVPWSNTTWRWHQSRHVVCSPWTLTKLNKPNVSTNAHLRFSLSTTSGLSADHCHKSQNRSMLNWLPTNRRDG